MEALPPAAPADCSPEDDAAVLLYTGGTTGVPKGAVLTHRNIVANTIQFARWYAFEPGGETAFCALPMYHSGGMSGAMNVPLSAAATLARAEPLQRAGGRDGRGPAPGDAALRRPDHVHRAPQRSARDDSADYSSLRACRTNAAPLPPSVKAEFDTLVGREVLVEGYGLTETSPLTHANPVGRAKAGSIGIPLPDTDARIVDLETGADVEPGRAGRAPDPRAAGDEGILADVRTRRRRRSATGGFARATSRPWTPEGYFAIVDRKKDMINTAGFKVWPREVEEALYEHPAIKLAAVVGVPDDTAARRSRRAWC